jgi:RNA polymerase sigma factor (sigma-70 family)
VSLGPDAHLALLYHFCRIQRPRLALTLAVFSKHAERMFERARRMQPAFDWPRFVANLQALDAFLVAACLEGLQPAWEQLFAAKVGRADRLLLDALRSRAARLYPRNEQEQQTAIDDFWGHLIVPPAEGTPPILARYDGQRPLVPWLLRVFQNRHISKLRSPGEHLGTLADDDQLHVAALDPSPNSVWHELFCDAARTWLQSLPDKDLVLLGLRWRYQLSQRETAQLLGIHEGTLSRQIDKLRENCLEEIHRQLESQGWTGEDLEGYVLSEMAGVLLDEPKLSLASLGQRMKRLGIKGPGGR